MNAKSAAWYAGQLLGARLVALSKKAIKIAIDVSAIVTISVLLKDGDGNRGTAIVQVAERGKTKRDNQLKVTSWPAILGSVYKMTSNAALGRGTDKMDFSELLQGGVLSPRQTLKFVTEFVFYACDVKELAIKSIPGRMALILVMSNGTVWLDCGRNAMISTSSSSPRPTRVLYKEGILVNSPTYKWVNTSGHNETVQACLLLMNEICKIAR